MMIGAALAFVSGAVLTLFGIETGEATRFVLGLAFTIFGFVGLVVSFTFPE